MYILTSFLLSFTVSSSLHAMNIFEAYLTMEDARLGVLVEPDEPSKKTRSFREEALNVKDIKRGFLETKNGVQFAKFNRRNGLKPLYVISWGSYPEDGRKKPILFLSRDKTGKWIDETPTILPDIPMIVIDAIDQMKCKPKSKLSDSASGTYRYVLPRKGTTIRAVVNSDRGPSCNKDLFSLAFDGLTFSMKL